MFCLLLGPHLGGALLCVYYLYSKGEALWESSPT